jgi:hypothetical protein
VGGDLNLIIKTRGADLILMQSVSRVLAELLIGVWRFRSRSTFDARRFIFCEIARLHVHNTYYVSRAHHTAPNLTASLVVYSIDCIANHSHARHAARSMRKTASKNTQHTYLALGLQP